MCIYFKAWSIYYVICVTQQMKHRKQFFKIFLSSPFDFTNLQYFIYLYTPREDIARNTLKIVKLSDRLQLTFRYFKYKASKLRIRMLHNGWNMFRFFKVFLFSFSLFFLRGCYTHVGKHCSTMINRREVSQKWNSMRQTASTKKYSQCT